MPPSARTADLTIGTSGLTTMNPMKPRHVQPGASTLKRLSFFLEPALSAL